MDPFQTPQHQHDGLYPEGSARHFSANHPYFMLDSLSDSSQFPSELSGRDPAHFQYNVGADQEARSNSRFLNASFWRNLLHDYNIRFGTKKS